MMKTRMTIVMMEFEVEGLVLRNLCNTLQSKAFRHETLL